MHIIKTIKLNTTQMAYIGLKPKSSPTNKYSQPLELVLFYYPHLLIITYLII